MNQIQLQMVDQDENLVNFQVKTITLKLHVKSL